MVSPATSVAPGQCGSWAGPQNAAGPRLQGWGLLCLGAASLALPWSAARASDCAILPPAHPTPASRTISAADLLSLRDFGDLGVDGSEHALVLSPDGRWLAVQLRQARPATNDYCSALIVLPTDGSGPARVIADAGDIEPFSTDRYGMAGITIGTPRTALVRWSPDGAWIAFVKARGAGAEIWRVRPDGRDARLVLSSAVAIDALAWTSASDGLIFTSRPALIDARRAIEREGLAGFHYDGRFWPLTSMTPYPPASVPSVTQVVEPVSGRLRPAVGSDLERLNPKIAPDWPFGATRVARADGGDGLAWAAPDHPGAVGSHPRIHVRLSGQLVPCSDDVCEDVTGLWWMQDGRTLLFLRREGVARSLIGLYRWRPENGAPRRLFVTKDAIFGCQQGGGQLLCAQEASTQPRRIVRIDEHSGTVRTLFDPNPDFVRFTLGPVERLSWRNAFGIETFGDLVLPTGTRPGHPLPLIVVQYESRGFLRGGTADDYPIQLYAAHGFAVLSFNRPPFYGLRGTPKSEADFAKANQSGWADRRNVQSSLETIIADLARRGIIDPKRVGITGQSDGASTATFALIHSNLFAAAALSTCCEDADMMATLGKGFADQYAESGYPRAGKASAGFWENSALALHATHRPVPLLIQASDQEARLALTTYTTLKNAGWPIEFYVFPDEAHVKFHPAHRLALYERSLRWFEQWLQAKDPSGQGDGPMMAQAGGDQPQADAQASRSTH